MNLNRYKFNVVLIALALFAQSCTKSVYSPVWYNISPIATHEVTDKGQWHAAGQYFDADNGAGASVSAMYSPVKHLLVGGGISTLGNKGSLLIDTSTLGIGSRQNQVDLVGGGYFNSKWKFLTFQCYVGLAYGSNNVKINKESHLKMAHQKMYVQPTMFIRLPRSMSFDLSWRISQLNYTGAQIQIGTLPSNDLSTAREIELTSPFRLQEVGIGYNYRANGPFTIGIKYLISSPLGAPQLYALDYSCVSTTLRVDISELKKINKTE